MAGTDNHRRDPENDPKRPDSGFGSNAGIGPVPGTNSLSPPTQTQTPGTGTTASLFVIQGPDLGKRYSLRLGANALGREASNPIRLHDSEISRKHAELVLNSTSGAALIRDLHSANGTLVNGKTVEQTTLRPGDHIHLGQTVMVFRVDEPKRAGRFSARVEMRGQSGHDRSAILRSIPATEGSQILQGMDSGLAENSLRERLSSLAILYQIILDVSHIVDLDDLLPQLLQHALEATRADRGTVLLYDETNTLVPLAARWRDQSDPQERMSISRSIVDYVLEHRQGVISSDAPADDRFGAAPSIRSYGIREAICVPIQGRHSTLGVMYIDVRALSASAENPGPQNAATNALRCRFSSEHLNLMAAIGQQAGLAIENTRLYKAKLEAERLAAVGQTIAMLSHHIKNILQGVRGGSYLIGLGLDNHDHETVRKGWNIVEKNQTKIYNLVMDMLSFSKDREPALEPGNLNETVGDVIELMQPRADELRVKLEWFPYAALPETLYDGEGVHRAVLNIVTNALDATESAPDAKVQVLTTANDRTLGIEVRDNGKGIPESEWESIFKVFASSKGSRGTGLGLPVSRKIVQEHGGRIVVASAVGQGTTFRIEIPLRHCDEPGISPEDAFSDLDPPTSFEAGPEPESDHE